MIKLLKRFASFVNYTSGPKNGSPNKLAPGTTVNEQGVQPGEGSRISAEEFNYLMNALASSANNALIASMDSFELLAGLTDDGQQITMPHMGRHPVFGSRYFALRDLNLDRVVLMRVRPDRAPAEVVEISPAAPAGSSQRATAFSASPRVNLGTPSPGLHVCGSTAFAATMTMWRCDETDPDNWTQLAGSVNPNGSTWVPSLVHDDVNNRQIGVVCETNQAPIFFYVVDGANVISTGVTTPALSFSSYTGGDGVKKQAVACNKSGLALFLDNNANDFICYRSTDGGLNWSNGTPPASPTFSPRVHSIQWEAQFLDETDVFVAVVQGGFPGIELYVLTSADGLTWNEVWRDDTNSFSAFNTGIDRFGEFLLITSLKQTNMNGDGLQVRSLANDKAYHIYNDGPGEAGNLPCNDGTAILLGNQTFGHKPWVSRTIKTGLVVDGSSLEEFDT